MTHKEFIVCMERNEAGGALFDKYRILYKRWKEPMPVTEPEPIYIDTERYEYRPLVVKLLSAYSDCIKKLSEFVSQEDGGFFKVYQLPE